MTQRYRVTISGISDKVPLRFLYTHSESKEGALRGVVSKILGYVQDPISPINKDWKYRDGKFSCPMNPKYTGLLVSYLLANSEYFTVEPL
jgi:hypothetical protein